MNKPRDIWRGMFHRCYSENYHLRKPTYKDCFVNNKWKDFKIFKKWYEINYVEGFQLDKDILFKNNKEYSSETCCFVPREINMLFVKSNGIRGKYLIGVNKINNRYRSSITMYNKFNHLGYYETELEAFNVYKLAKENYIKELADKWKNNITESVYNALYDYTVDIND